MKWSIGDQTIDVSINRNWQNANEYAFYTRDLENGGLYTVDRGADSDKYSANIEVIGTIDKMDDLVSLLGVDTERHVLVTEINDGEKVFGCHIDYSGDPEGYGNQLWQVEVVGTYKQRTLTTFSMPMTVTLLSGADNIMSDAPIVTTSATPPAVWRPINSYSVTIGDRRTVTQTYDMYAVDSRRNASANAFMCDIEFSTEDMAKLLGYYVYKRGAVEANAGPTITLLGVNHPFGADVSWPCAFHLVSITSVQMYAPTRWRCSAMIRRAVS